MRPTLLLLAILFFVLIWCGEDPEDPPDEDDPPTEPIEDED